MNRRLTVLVLTLAATLLAACASPTAPTNDCTGGGLGLGSGQHC